MLLAYLQNKTNALAAEWDRKRAQIRTAAALEDRNRFVRERCKEMIHGLPDRTPLNPVIVRVLERDGYRIESLMFESRPISGSLPASMCRRERDRFPALFRPAAIPPTGGCIAPISSCTWAW